jgi:hypothetical protein
VKTEPFRRDLLAIGRAEGDGGTINRTNSIESPSSLHTADDNTLQTSNDSVPPDEEGSLMAAGNGCVVLALLIAGHGHDSDQPYDEFTKSCRNVINNEISDGLRDEDGVATGVSLVINTLKAFRNLWLSKIGDCSSIDDVRRLIKRLEATETHFVLDAS